MRDVFVLEALRTPFGKLRGGLSTVRPDDLLAQLLAKLVQKSGVEPGQIDEVIAGCANQAGEDNRNVARMASLLAGIPYEVPAYTVNRLCASGLSAVVQGARAIAVGDAELVIACGVESMTRAPWVLGKAEEAFASGTRTVFDSALGWRFPNPRLAALFPLEAMGETAENLARAYNISRAEQDAFAYESHTRVIAAQAAGRMDAELVAVERGEKLPPLSCDEGPRADTSLERLATLKPVFLPDGTVTAGNASSLNDGAAAVLLASRDKASQLGKTTLARVVANGVAGVDPRRMGIGPVPAMQRALLRAGLTMAQMDRIEINEAFAAQVLAVSREVELPTSKLNVNGGAIAIGHPLGASGVRLVGTLVHELRRRGGGLGLAALCVGVGQGECVVLES